MRSGPLFEWKHLNLNQRVKYGPKAYHHSDLRLTVPVKASNCDINQPTIHFDSRNKTLQRRLWQSVKKRSNKSIGVPHSACYKTFKCSALTHLVCLLKLIGQNRQVEPISRLHSYFLSWNSFVLAFHFSFKAPPSPSAFRVSGVSRCGRSLQRKPLRRLRRRRKFRLYKTFASQLPPWGRYCHAWLQTNEPKLNQIVLTSCWRLDIVPTLTCSKA